MSPPVGEVARSAGGASLAQYITACYKCNVTFCAKLTKDQPCIVLIVQSDEKSSFANKRSVLLAKLTAQYTHNLCAVLP